MRLRNRTTQAVLALTMLLATALPVRAQSEADVVKSFKIYVANYLASYKTNKREQVRKLGGGWARTYFEASTDSSVDVRRTDSLVSPYAGILEFTLIEHFTAFHKTQAEAETDNTFVQSSATKHRHTYAFQDGAWVPKSRQHYLAILGEWLDCEHGDGCWEEDPK